MECTVLPALEVVPTVIPVAAVEALENRVCSASVIIDIPAREPPPPMTKLSPLAGFGEKHVAHSVEPIAKRLKNIYARLVCQCRGAGMVVDID